MTDGPDSLKQALENSVWNSPRTEEASEDVFENGRPQHLETPEGAAPSEDRMIFGDSRPDRLDPGGFAAIGEDDPRMETVRGMREGPEIRKEDAHFLAEHRVDQKDEIVAEPDPILEDRDVAVLRPRISKQGAESEEL